jgi:S-methylmethionine-dependent homocysteine/selenocysteine methylase
MTRTEIPVTLLDGGTGSELRRHGIALDTATWSAAAGIDHRRTLTAIHADYIAAGADVITANTFAATPFVLAAAGFGDRLDALIDTAVGAARDAVLAAANDTSRQTDGPRRIRRREVGIAGSLSCYPPLGDPAAYPSPAAELAGYRRSASLLARAGVDLLLVEMMQDPEHGSRACRAAAETGVPFWLGLSCRRSPTGGLAGFDRVDVPFTATLEALLEFGPAAVTVMHSPLDVMDEALEIVTHRFGGPRGAYPEIPYAENPALSAADRARARATPVTPAAIASAARRWLAAGATIVGGCCGTRPAHIAALRREIDAGQA